MIRDVVTKCADLYTVAKYCFNIVIVSVYTEQKQILEYLKSESKKKIIDR